MAEGDFLNFNILNYTGAASGFVDFLIMLVIALIVIGILWGCLYILSFKHTIRVRQTTGSGRVIIDTKAREFKTADGIVKWRLLKWIRTTVIAPPMDYLEFTKKGRFSAECDRDANGEIIWRKRNNDPSGVDVFTSEEKIILVNELRRAHEYNRKNLMNRLFELAPMILSVMIVILIFAFWGDFVNSTTTASGQVELASANLAEASGALLQGLKYCYGDINITDVGIVVDTGGLNVPPIPIGTGG